MYHLTSPNNEAVSFEIAANQTKTHFWHWQLNEAEKLARKPGVLVIGAATSVNMAKND